MKLPYWIHHPADALTSALPTKQDIIDFAVDNLMIVVGVYVGVVGAVYVFQGADLPGGYTMPVLSANQEAFAAYGTPALAAGYLIEQKIEEIISDPNPLILQPLKPWEESHEAPVKVPDDAAGGFLGEEQEGGR